MTRSEIHAEIGAVPDADLAVEREMAPEAGVTLRADRARRWRRITRRGFSKFGCGTDAPRPRILTDKERQERHRKRKRAKQISASVARAIAGQGALPKFGVQQFHLIGAGAAG